MPRKVKPRGVTDAPPLDHADADQLYTVEQTCRLLQISDWLVRKCVRTGMLPAVFIEGMTRIGRPIFVRTSRSDGIALKT